MRLELIPTLAQVQVAGGATRSLLGAVRKRLHRTEIERLVFWHYEVETEGYESLLDALFVETFPEFRPACVAFYARTGPPLRKILTADEARAYDIVLVGLIEMGHYRRLLGEPGGWSAVQESFYRFITPRPSLPGALR